MASKKQRKARQYKRKKGRSRSRSASNWFLSILVFKVIKLV